MAFVKSVIPHCVRNDHQNLIINKVEGMVFELTISKNKWLIATLYKPPTVSDYSFAAMFAPLVEAMLNETKYIMVVGDLNFNMNVDNKLTELCCLLGLKNVICGNTCFKGENGSSIDVMLVSNKYCVSDSFNDSVGISDFHNLIGCSLKAFAPEKYRKHILYRSYKRFNDECYLNDLQNLSFEKCLSTSSVNEQYDEFNSLYCDLLNRHAPIKSKTITKPAPPFMNGELRKAIYKKCMLRNKFYKYRDAQHWEKYRAQRNLVTSIRRQSIRIYFEKHTEDVNNADFWKIMKPFLSEKSSKGSDDIILRESGTLLTDPYKVCDTFNDFYTTAAEKIGFHDTIPNCLSSSDILSYVRHKYSNHPSIIEIKSHRTEHMLFSFNHTNEYEVEKIISKLDVKKAIGHDAVPVKIVKLGAKYLTPVVTRLINNCIDKCIFPHCLKLAEVSSVFKKKDRLCKENYRPISILVIVSKVYEKIFVKRMSLYVKTVFNPLLSAYRNGYGCSDVLLKFVSMWKKALDDNMYTGALLMDLSKAFDCLPHCLLVAKLHAYGFTDHACLLVASYLSNRKQRVKMGSTKSSWKGLDKGVPQGSILGPVLFNFFIHDLFFFINKCTLLNYADDDTLLYSHYDINELYSVISEDTNIAIDWFERNGMKANPDKFQFIACHRRLKFTNPILISGMTLHPEESVKLLGVTIDKMLTFDKHLGTICQKASNQLNVLKRFSNILGQKQKLRIFKTFVASNFNYCPVVWNFCSKTKAHLVEKLQKRGLRYVFNDDMSTYTELLQKANIETMCNVRLKKIAVYVYKCLHNISPSFLHDTFLIKTNSYNMRSSTILNQPRVNTVLHGLQSFNYHGAKVWNQLPEYIKVSPTLAIFKRLLAKYDQPLCACSYCSLADTHTMYTNV